ncbi:MAG: hypothetical protein PHW82_06530, partial [Bacteroidales bacterium]|nr:hypothetical protein [Bacteroidales bacterium]
FLITDGENLINDEELFEFLPDDDKFEYVEGIMNIYEFIGNKQIDEYIKTALKSVDADKIIPHIEPYLQTLRKTQLGAEEQYEEERAKNKMSPKILVEVYNIEKDYKPVKVNEFKISHMSSLFILPEFRDMINGDRVAYKAIEIETGEVIENEINEAIEGIKHEKWMRKHPSVIDLSVLQRMELDNDDPNFISWDDYVANDDEYEEGDDEYSPEF